MQCSPPLVYVNVPTPLVFYRTSLFVPMSRLTSWLDVLRAANKNIPGDKTRPLFQLSFLPVFMPGLISKRAEMRTLLWATAYHSLRPREREQELPRIITRRILTLQSSAVRVTDTSTAMWAQLIKARSSHRSVSASGTVLVVLHCLDVYKVSALILSCWTLNGNSPAAVFSL